jgi:predicted Zn-dependent protease
MSESARIESLRRRVQQDPSSIAFAQLAEEYRRAGQLQEAVDTARGGLKIHPAYHSARVTLGRALVELKKFEDAQRELEQVLKSAPENLAAIKALAEAHHQQGSIVEALRQYRAALVIARHDPDIEQTVRELTRKVDVETPPVSVSAQAEQVSPASAGVSSRAFATVAALEQWLHAVHVARAKRCA